MVEQRVQATTKGAAGFKPQAEGLIAARQSSKRRRTACTLLRTSVNHIVRASRLLYLTSAIGEPFPPVLRRTDHQLVADAKAILERVMPLAAAFTDSGLLPADLLTNLPGQIADVESAFAAQGVAKETHAGATVAAAETIRQGALAVRALEPVFFHANAGDANAIQQWKIAKR